MNTIKKLTSQFIVVLITLAGTLAIWEYWQKENKSLEIVVNSKVTIASLGSNKIDGLELLYKSKPIDSLSIIELTFSNNGNVPIRPNDITDSVQIHFSGDIAIKPDVINVYPKQLNPKFEVINNSTVSLGKLLMNPDDRFTVKFYVTNFSGDFSEDLIEGRISGVKQINIIDNAKKKELGWISIVALVVSAAASITVLNVISEKFSKYMLTILPLLTVSIKQSKNGLK